MKPRMSQKKYYPRISMSNRGENCLRIDYEDHSNQALWFQENIRDPVDKRERERGGSILQGELHFALLYKGCSTRPKKNFFPFTIYTNLNNVQILKYPLTKILLQYIIKQLVCLKKEYAINLTLPPLFGHWNVAQLSRTKLCRCSVPPSPKCSRK